MKTNVNILSKSHGVLKFSTKISFIGYKNDLQSIIECIHAYTPATIIILPGFCWYVLTGEIIPHCGIKRFQIRYRIFMHTGSLQITYRSRYASFRSDASSCCKTCCMQWNKIHLLNFMVRNIFFSVFGPTKITT